MQQLENFVDRDQPNLLRGIQEWYTEPSYWQHFKDYVDNKWPYPIIVVDVGKSSLLKRICEYSEEIQLRTFYFYSCCDISDEKFAEIWELVTAQQKVTVIIDNLQELPKSEKGRHVLKTLLKEKEHFSECRLFVTTSRQCLPRVLKTLSISSAQSLTIATIGAEKRVVDELLKVFYSNKDDVTSMNEFAGSVGYVPGVVKRAIVYRLEMSEDFSVYQKEFIEHYTMQIKKILLHDLQEMDPQMLQCYLKCLGIISLNREVRIADYNFLFSDIPWTFLTRCSLSGVKAVSGVVADVVQDFLFNDGVSLGLKLEYISEILQGERIGNKIGDFLERMVYQQLAHILKLEYVYWDSEVREFKNESLSLPEHFEMHKVSGISFGTFLQPGKTSMIIYGPNVHFFDFLIRDGNGKSHALQVTTQCRNKKYNGSRKFYKLADSKKHTYDHIYLLSIESTSNIQGSVHEALEKYALRLVNPDSGILPSTFLQILRRECSK